MADFTLFQTEEKLLADIQGLEQRLDGADLAAIACVGALIQGFARSVREQRRLVRVSDRLQEQLSTLNQEISRRRKEAEDALVRLQQTQEELVQAEKLASLGALVGGVAHEINTPVGIALSCASHLEEATARLRSLVEADDLGVDDFNGYLETAMESSRLVLANCQRAADLIRSFKQVAVDRTNDRRRDFDLRESLQETLHSLGPAIRHAGHTLTLSCPSDLKVNTYPGALSQVISNFIMNALVHAYAPGQNGHLSVVAALADDGEVRLSVSDDGKGIPEENRHRVFDPFFTTSRGSGGSGLGLHVVYNLVTGPLGGTVTLESPPDGGSTFTVTFPVIAPAS